MGGGPRAAAARPSGDDGVRRYLQELSAHRLLTAADEVALGRAIAAGRQAAAALAGRSAPAAERRRLEQLVAEGDAARERIRQIEAKALTKLRHPCAPPALRQLVHS